MDLDEILHLLAKLWGGEATAEEKQALQRWLGEHHRDALWIRMLEATETDDPSGPPGDRTVGPPVQRWARLRAAPGAAAATDPEEEGPQAQAA